METIEQACLLGHLQEIDKILDQSIPIDKLDDFISAIGCCIEYQNLKVFNHLLQKKHFHEIIIHHQTRIKTLIIQNDSTSFMQAFNQTLSNLGATNSFFAQQIQLPLQEFEPPLITLDDDEQRAIRDLTQYYQTILSNHSLEFHLQQLKNYLAEQYQKNPATFEHTPLALHWEGFHHLISEENYQTILKAYYQHPTHTAWRYLLSNNPWRSQENEFFFKQNHKNNQWFIILIWYAAQDKNFSEQNIMIHSENFIQTLATLNRAGNTDCLSGDKPLPSKDIRRSLLKVLNQHPLAISLDDSRIEKEEQEFVIKKWLEIFSKLSIEQYLQIKYHWEKAQAYPQQHEYEKIVEKFNLTDHQIDEFQKLMALKWGNRWKDHNHFIHKSKIRLKADLLLSVQWKNLFKDLIEKHSNIQNHTSLNLQFFKQTIIPTQITEDLNKDLIL